MIDKESNEIYKICIKLLNEGRGKEALALADTISFPALRAVIFIDGGTDLGRSRKVREGTEILKGLLSSDQSDLPFSKSSLLYSTANGYYSVYMLRRKRRKKTVPPNDEDLRSAKNLYREALETLDKPDGSFASQLWVNYGNCLSQFGRHIEAIECYHKALEAESTNGMAAGNLGVELEHVAHIMGRYRHEYIALAHDFLSRALSSEMHLNYGSDLSIQNFQSMLEGLQHFIDAHDEPILPPKPVEDIKGNKFKKEYVRFCLDNGLFLNAWVGDIDLSPGITDEVHFGPIVTESGDVYLVPELLRILNEIKESFATARYLLFLSQKRSHIQDDVSGMTTYFGSMSAFEINGLYMGLCKTAYSRAFDILDKVARIINIYFKVGKRESSFWHIFAEKQSLGKAKTIRYGARPAIRDIGNFGLYALTDLCIDYFESNHLDLKTIDTRRNKITHDYLTVKLHMTDEEKQDDSIVALDDFQEQTREVLKLVK